MSAHLYRQSKLGDSLVEALDQLVDEGKIPGELALKVMQQVGLGAGAWRTGGFAVERAGRHYGRGTLWDSRQGSVWDGLAL